MNETFDYESKLYEALKPHLVPFESHPDVVGTGFCTVDGQYAVKVLVRDLASATRNHVEDAVPSPIIVILDDSQSVSLPVHFEEVGEIVLGH